VLRTPLIRAKAFHNIKLSLTIKSFVWFLRTTIDTNQNAQGFWRVSYEYLFIAA
jgi:hypothetical protein